MSVRHDPVSMKSMGGFGRHDIYPFRPDLRREGAPARS